MALTTPTGAGFWDNFTELATGFMQLRAEEAKADATGAAQAALNNTVEQSSNVNQNQPLNSTQYAGLMQSVQGNSGLLIGGALALVGLILLVKK